MSLETKMARIWQALLRHSENGRFGNPEAGGANPICSALCLETVNRILVACGASTLLTNVLVGGLANSIYTKYDPDQGFEQQEQYADVAFRQAKTLDTQEQEIVKLNKLRELSEQHVFDQLSAAGVGQLLQQMDLSRRVSAVTEMLAPVLDDELLLVLWNSTATTQASASQLLRAKLPDTDGNGSGKDRKLRDLLCTYVEPAEPIQDRFHRCENAREKRLELELVRSDDERKLTNLMNSFISCQRRSPELLVNAVNRSPETLLSAIALNPGMLLFAITKFADPVKRFLSLDPKACDYLDALIQKNKGVQLLWKHTTLDAGGHEPFLQIGRRRKITLAAEELAAALPSGDSLEREALLLLEWFTSHLNDLTDLLLEHPKPLQLLLTKMHQRGDAPAFHQLMLFLQQTAGVQDFISRASMGSLERLALEDQTAVLQVLREIFQCRESSGEDNGDASRSNRASQELLLELQASPHLVTCLSAMDPNVLQEVFLGNIDLWSPFFVDIVTSNDALLRQCLTQRTSHADGGDTLLRLFTAVMEGTTATLDLEALDSEAKTAETCELSPPSYDVFLYYLHVLAHIFYGQMKIFKPEASMRSLCAEIEALPRSRAAMSTIDSSLAQATDGSNEDLIDPKYDAVADTYFVELDDVMEIFLKQWAEKTRQTDERYRQAFTAHDLGGNRIGLDEFTKIVTGVTAGRITARECRLVYGDAGQEFLDMDAFLCVTRAYQLRAFDVHLPEVALDECDLQDLRLSVGRTNITSTQREVEDLARYWRSVRSDVVHQLDAAHQKKTTKALLKTQSELIEKLVVNTPPLHQQLLVQPSPKRYGTSAAQISALQEKLDTVWHEVRTKLSSTEGTTASEPAVVGEALLARNLGGGDDIRSGVELKHNDQRQGREMEFVT
ncbi:hypothetical protein PHYBOEH_005637 [Phytophthora boehmeriae]|uniref:Uncharacterized protein n=1 Tax=Phytophthora boehmeriae TaxID=109152 RepID=A0A8T1WNT9_9STRA|nr:hypothetical protein PHYBOEH_005637 [Phytophthora boehmeriae]